MRRTKSNVELFMTRKFRAEFALIKYRNQSGVSRSSFSRHPLEGVYFTNILSERYKRLQLPPNISVFRSSEKKKLKELENLKLFKETRTPEQQRNANLIEQTSIGRGGGVKSCLFVEFCSLISNEIIPINLTNTCFRLTEKKMCPPMHH